MQTVREQEPAPGFTAREISAAFAFMKVAECESFREAGRQLGISRSAISKHVALLERNLGVTLLNRTPRSISLTDAGSAFYENWRQISEAIVRAAQEVSRQDERPAGMLRVSVPSSLGAALMPWLVSDVIDQWPEIRLNVHFGDEFVDVVGGGYDAVVRLGQKLADSSLYARRIMTTPKVVVAAPSYLAKRGTPRHPKDLQKHHCVGRGRGSILTWSFKDSGGSIDVVAPCVFTANSDMALIAAACRGAGLLYLPQLLVAKELSDGRLVRVLESFCRGQEFGVFVIHPYKKCPAKVRVFVDVIERRIRAP